MSEVEDVNSEVEVFYLPHQAVIRKDKLTTKLRVVFDGSAKSSNGNSLNDKLLCGPNLQNDLIDILLRFRIHQIVITSDIKMMYRQILIREEDRPLQRILWREKTDLPIKIFNLNTVTYGTSCAPFLAMRCLRKLAEDERKDYPLAAAILENDCYMDDVLTGTNTITEALELQKQLTKLLARGKFKLRKWRSNKPEVLKHLQKEDQADELLLLEQKQALKTLGVLWNSKTDELQFNVTPADLTSITKRTVLSTIARIYPLGLIGPIVIEAKHILQNLWQLKLSWDEPLPQELNKKWSTYIRSLSKINKICISSHLSK